MSIISALIGLLAGGGAGVSDIEVVTIGVTGAVGPPVTAIYGYSQSSFGSISDGAFAPKGGAAITQLYFVHTATPTNALILSITGGFTNDGWTTMTAGGFTFNRADASFSSGSSTTWNWNTTNNPFAAGSGDVEVVFA